MGVCDLGWRAAWLGPGTGLSPIGAENRRGVELLAWRLEPECHYVGPIVIEGDEIESVTAESLPREEQVSAVRGPDNRLAEEDLFRT